MDVYPHFIQTAYVTILLWDREIYFQFLFRDYAAAPAWRYDKN